MATHPQPVDSSSVESVRRHDLDALRAFAMLLGIALHAALSFCAIPPWTVKDTRQSDLFGLLFAAIHGFRMPLFFLISGYFTALLWRRRGVRGLLVNRSMRILLPCILGVLTIVPALNWVSVWAGASGESKPDADDGSLVYAIRKHDPAAIRTRLDKGVDLNAPDAAFGVTPVSWSALLGDAETLRLLADRGADVNASNRDGAKPLHSAVFLGRLEAVEVLLDKGAKPDARDGTGRLPLENTTVDWETTRFLAGLLGIPIGDQAEMERDRKAVQRLITTRAPEAASASSPAPSVGSGPRAWYTGLFGSKALQMNIRGHSFNLMFTPVFHHLWFLWFLCWFVPAFALFFSIAERRGWQGPPRGRILSGGRFFWLIPLTMIPQWFMGFGGISFGPDTSVGLLLMPHLLIYYGIFFGFGALYFESHDDEGRLGRYWSILLPTSILFVLPVALITITNHAISGVAQVIYVWAMSVGMIGFFRRVLPHESKAIRYLSDSSYWLYIAHLPLVIAAQAIVRDWPLPAFVKFLLITSVVTGSLLLTYATLVRYTWLGALLNGRRERPAT